MSTPPKPSRNTANRKTTDPIADEQGGQPERRIGRILKIEVLVRRRVTLVVELNRVGSASLAAELVRL
jgi:hypothetical protein